jgi:hypothetical protein
MKLIKDSTDPHKKKDKCEYQLLSFTISFIQLKKKSQDKRVLPFQKAKGEGL